ncbi:CoA-binding protein [soil metagenome]
MTNKKTLVLGASPNLARYSSLAIQRLRAKGHEVVAIGKRKGTVADVDINLDQPEIPGLDTVTLYLNARNQRNYYDYIISQKPRRIIYNPGAENYELKKLADEHGIQSEEACTLVLLSIGQY